MRKVNFKSPDVQVGTLCKALWLRWKLMCNGLFCAAESEQSKRYILIVYRNFMIPQSYPYIIM